MIPTASLRTTHAILDGEKEPLLIYREKAQEEWIVLDDPEQFDRPGLELVTCTGKDLLAREPRLSKLWKMPKGKGVRRENRNGEWAIFRLSELRREREKAMSPSSAPTASKATKPAVRFGFQVTLAFQTLMAVVWFLALGGHLVENMLHPVKDQPWYVPVVAALVVLVLLVVGLSAFRGRQGFGRWLLVLLHGLFATVVTSLLLKEYDAVIVLTLLLTMAQARPIFAILAALEGLAILNLLATRWCRKEGPAPEATPPPATPAQTPEA